VLDWEAVSEPEVVAALQVEEPAAVRFVAVESAAAEIAAAVGFEARGQQRLLPQLSCDSLS